MEQPERVTRDIHLDEAVPLAIELQKRGQLTDAEEVYRRYLEIRPDDPEGLHYSGVLAQQQGRSEEAVALIERSLALRPDLADWHSNLGIVLKAQGRIDEAVAAYRRAIALDPDHANAQNNLGVLLRTQDKLEEAEEAYRAAVRANPKHLEAWHNLGTLLAASKRLKEAITCYCTVTTLCPDHPAARRSLAIAHAHLGEMDKATAIYREWLEEEPDNPVARHMLAACSGLAVPPRAGDDYIETVFDVFAETFEAKLQRLSYRAPAIVRAMLEDAGLTPTGSLDVLDAGCGTGMCAPLIAPYARRLTGVDLSAGMLARAQEKNLYDELAKHELTEYLRGRREAYDVIVSADTLVYFGPLEEVAAAAAQALRPDGWLVFTVEDAADADLEAGFELGPDGRYRHKRGYVERVLAEVGLSPEIASAELRMELGEPVAGLAVRARRLGGALASSRGDAPSGTR